ncbi:MAG: hypothetical protein IPN34_22710 [Planctomycetes bacterium]|nr:hypothetical protein [Planctomycetota bacterium]
MLRLSSFARLLVDPRLYTALGLALAATAAGGLVSSGSCVWYVSTDCDDEYDDDCDDDDDYDSADVPTLELPRPAEGWRLARYRSEMRVDEGRPRLARLTDIEGPSLRELKPVGRFGEEELRAFCRSVLRANELLLGLPESRGFLVAQDVVFHSDCILVHFQQYEEPEEGHAFALEGRGLVFALDPRGKLLEVEIATWLGPR